MLKSKEFTDKEIDTIIDLAKADHIQGLSILGGEPMHPKNIEGTTKLAKAFKEKYPDKSLWAWSGYLFDEYLTDKEIVNYLDVLVDGRYKDELRDPRLKFAGSTNQRAIDVKKSLKKGEVVLYEEQ